MYPDWLTVVKSVVFAVLSSRFTLFVFTCLQMKAYQLLMTYSAAYMKLLVSQRLTGPSNHRLHPQRNHCTTAPFCLCQYIKKKILQ